MGSLIVGLNVVSSSDVRKHLIYGVPSYGRYVRLAVLFRVIDEHNYGLGSLSAFVFSECS